MISPENELQFENPLANPSTDRNIIDNSRPTVISIRNDRVDIVNVAINGKATDPSTGSVFAAIIKTIAAGESANISAVDRFRYADPYKWFIELLFLNEAFGAFTPGPGGEVEDVLVAFTTLGTIAGSEYGGS